jgi:hypothetical protein
MIIDTQWGVILWKAIFLAISYASVQLFAQNAAVSSYLRPNDNFTGDIRIKEVRVPKTGYAVNTYYCVLGWSGSVAGASGYGGIQYSSSGGNNYIYSIWNDFVTTDYLDPKMTFQTFGGEGTGVKSMTYAYPWSPDYWNVLADRAWDVGNKTYTAFFVKDGKTGVWRHLITMNIPIAHERYAGDSYNFLEDWVGNGIFRQSHIRMGWKRRDSNKAWFPITQATYSVNTADFSNRSSNMKTNWEGGKSADASGEYFFMSAGGTIAGTNNSNTVLTIPRATKTPQEEYGKARVSKISSMLTSDNTKAIISWINDSLTVPQYAYKITISDGSTVLITSLDTIPQKRSDTLDISKLNPALKKYTVTLAITDMFDGPADPVMVDLGSSFVGLNSKLSPRMSSNLPRSRLYKYGMSKLQVNSINISGRYISKENK